MCVGVFTACRVILWQFYRARLGEGEAWCKKGRRSTAHFAHPPGPLFKMGSVFANVVVVVAVTLEEQAAVERGGWRHREGTGEYTL